ncbi:MAG: glycosyltransferase family 2 protein [Azoarcus sp.]|jgi:glycosyltransferase involved in cell wall biosynthesis|nr:glycosyltransferase family 2 protein [Azoarcus sp.]
MQVSVVIPAKNEAAAIGDLLTRLVALKIADEIIVVDDGSTDDTAAVATRAGARVISHHYSKGNGAAIKTGARAAVGEVIVFMDGDGQHNPNDIARLLDRLGEGFDMVVGARNAGGQASTGRHLANTLYNHLASWMSEQHIADLTSGFRVVRAEKFREFLPLLPNGFSYPTTSTMAFFRAGHTVAYVPITVAKRIGKSHIRPLRDGLRFLLIIFRIATLYSPLKLFTPIAVFFMGGGLLYYLYTYSLYGRFTNMSALLLTTAVIIFLIGLVSEQITQLIYIELDGRGQDRKQ